jgi:hypothetical protein
VLLTRTPTEIVVPVVSAGRMRPRRKRVLGATTDLLLWKVPVSILEMMSTSR